jgi:hypothetical protein
MGQLAALFALTIFSSMAGFGGALEVGVAPTKALAVVSLLLFFVMLYRVLGEPVPSRSTDS